MKLFSACSIMKEFEGYKDVPIIWYIPERKTPVLLYSELIEDYNEEDEDSFYSEGYANSFFTEGEIIQLKRVLSKFKEKIKISVAEETFPFEKNRCSYGIIPSGTLNGSFFFTEAVYEDVGFRFEGYYDLRPFIEGWDKRMETDVSNLNESLKTQTDDGEFQDDIPF